MTKANSAGSGDRDATCVSQLTAVILAGGLGTRLRLAVPDQPKVLATINGRPFLTYIFDQLLSAGIRDVVLCTGHLSQVVRECFGSAYRSLRISQSMESRPLGTGGALRLALSMLQSDPLLVMNGDSYCAVSLRHFWKWHENRRAAATVLLTGVSDSERFGQVQLAGNGEITKFAEKGVGRGPGLINAGVYLLRRAMISTIPAETTVSLEREIFPQWIGRGFYGCQTNARFIDIGTPEAYAKAPYFFGDLKSAG